MSKFLDMGRYASKDEALIDMSWIVLRLLFKLDGEVTLTGAEIKALEDREAIMVCVPLDDGGVTYRLEERYVEHEQVKPGGWLHVMSGTAILVKGVTRDGFVRYHVQVGEPGEHLHELSVDQFLLGHVPSDSVPFIGGEA